ncbi:MAG: twin-arginine translocation signal domain-containing protein [Terriglobales bacterium]
MNRRGFLRGAAAAPALAAAQHAWPQNREAGGASASQPAIAAPTDLSRGLYRPGRIENDFDRWLPGEREALQQPPRLAGFDGAAVRVQAAAASGEAGRQVVSRGATCAGWRLVAVIGGLNGVPTAVWEKQASHQGVIVYATLQREILRIPKHVGRLANIRPRPVHNLHDVRFERPAAFPRQPDVPGEYILNSAEDPCYENVAALGAELIGWTLVGNEEAGPLASLYLEADGRSRQLNPAPAGETIANRLAPDSAGRIFDPRDFLPSEYHFDYIAGYSKRTLLGGYLPVADIGVWNPRFRCGYEVMVLLPPGPNATPMARIRVRPPAGHSPQEDRYWNTNAEGFFVALAGIANHWQDFFAGGMQADIPDPWLADAARAGITLARCSYRGLEPSYQIGEGAYTKIPERSHALFPVAHYEFVWAQQLWGLTAACEPYFQHYLDHYILPDGNFLYNTQDQVEAPLNAGVFLENSARAYDYTGDLATLRRRLPALERMAGLLVRRYRDSLRRFPSSDPRHGLIWGSPEADLGDVQDDDPQSHLYYYQNASWAWRGLHEHARCLARAAGPSGRDLLAAARHWARLAVRMRGHIEASLALTLAARNPAMKAAGITPFSADDTRRRPEDLSSYENHRFMMDWWTSDWGEPELDLGHFRHRELAGEQLIGMNTDGHYARTSNFMEHGTLAGRIRQDDYRPFLLALYGNVCYAMDGGNRYAPEDALLPGGRPLEGSPYAWSAVVNSTLQPTMGLRWLLCYEEHGAERLHLQKAAPKHWFAPGQAIRIANCPTRHGPIAWSTVAKSGADGRPQWEVEMDAGGAVARLARGEWSAGIWLHIHPPNGGPLRGATLGRVAGQVVKLGPQDFANRPRVRFIVR